jgi:hypothetical protein
MNIRVLTHHCTSSGEISRENAERPTVFHGDCSIFMLGNDSTESLKILGSKAFVNSLYFQEFSGAGNLLQANAARTSHGSEKYARE